ncbi:serine hydrolase domain-containing protein [Paraburkholderia sp. RL17-381-BIF-C]|uniref:serine hydrolase domain-containing protein n=1 Tax=Paraburkholderia sp. RL17-381-BIF-C TaxID=3031635 RepID=UPI0038BC3D1F
MDRNTQAAAPDSIRQKITELLAAINSNDRLAIRAFLDENVVSPPASRKHPARNDLEWLLGFFRITQGVDLLSVVEDTSNSTVVVTVEDRVYAGWHEIRLIMESGGSGRIFEMTARPTLTRNATRPRLATTDLAEQARALCEKGFNAGVFSGAVLIAHGGEVLFEYACGHANKRFHINNGPDTKFNLGSANKMFTAVALAQLTETGQLSFEDSLDNYLSDEWLPASVSRRVKIKHLPTHTSGLGSYFNETFFKTSRDLFRSIDDFKVLVRDDSPAFEPGSEFLYSNSGMLLAGAVIERVTGADYFSYVLDRIFAPSEMFDTDCYDIDDPIENLAMGYVPTSQNRSGWRENIFTHVAKGGPAGGGFSTVRDLHRFAMTLLSDRLISRKTRDLLWRDHIGAQYGYGFFVSGEGSDLKVGHAGGFPGISADFEIQLNGGFVTVVLSNYDLGALELSRRLHELVDQLYF